MENRWKGTPWVLTLLLCLWAGGEACAQDWKSVVTGVAKAVAEKKGVSAAPSLEGTWVYSAPDCKFTADNLLAKAGGEVAARKVEEQMTGILSAIGFTEGCTYTFNADSTYTSTVKGRTTRGTYSYDAATKELHLKTKLGLKFTATVSRPLAGDRMSLLFNADKVMSLVQSVGGFLGGKSSNSVVSSALSVLDKYDGLQLGFELEKQ